MDIKLMSTFVGVVMLIGGIGWTASEITASKIDYTALAASQADQDYIRYEELIEEAQEEQRTLKSLPEPLRNPVHDMHYDQLEQRIKKYEKRQERLK